MASVIKRKKRLKLQNYGRIDNERQRETEVERNSKWVGACGRASVAVCHIMYVCVCVCVCVLIYKLQNHSKQYVMIIEFTNPIQEKRKCPLT